MEVHEQNSFFTNENLCQSYMSYNLSTDCSKKVIQLKNSSSELEKINTTLKLTLERYNNDLNEYFQEIESLKKKNAELEMKLQNKQITSVEIQTENQYKNDSESQTDNYNDREKNKGIERLQQKQQKINEDISKTEKKNNPSTPKRKNERLCKQYSSSPYSQQNNSLQVTPEEEVNCEYFESKKHLESMIKKIQKHFKQLQSDIHDSYPSELTKNTIIQSLNNIQSLIDYLKILLDDQLIEIKQYAFDLQNEANQIIEEAKLIYQNAQRSQQIHQQGLAQNTQISQNNELNFNQDLESLTESNIKTINTIQNSDEFQLEFQFIKKDQDRNEYEYLLFSNKINEQRSSSQNNWSHQNLLGTSSENNQQIQKLNLPENNLQLINPEYIRNSQQEYDFTKDSQKEICQQQNEQIIKMCYSGAFPNQQDAQINEYDYQNQCEDLLENLVDEEFDFDQNYFQSNNFKQNIKKKDFKQQQERINKIMAFSFGSHPNNELTFSSQSLAKQTKQSIVNQADIKGQQNLQTEDENQKKLQFNLQFYLKNYIDFINSIQKLFNLPLISLDNQNQIDITKLCDESSQIKLNSIIQEYQNQILQKLTNYEQIKDQLEQIQKENNILSMSESNQDISVQESQNIFESIGQSFEADQIQNQFISSIKFILNERNMNAHKIKNNMSNLKKIFGKDNEEICIQYESYGIISADLIFIIKYVDSLKKILNQVNIKTFEKIKDYLIEKISLDIDSLPISKKLKTFIDFVKASIRQSIFLKYINSI